MGNTLIAFAAVWAWGGIGLIVERNSWRKGYVHTDERLTLRVLLWPIIAVFSFVEWFDEQKTMRRDNKNGNS